MRLAHGGFHLYHFNMPTLFWTHGSCYVGYQQGLSQVTGPKFIRELSLWPNYDVWRSLESVY